MIKIQKSKNKYYTIPNHFIDDPSLSLSTKGLLVWLYTREDSKIYNYEDLMKYNKVTEKELDNMFSELSSEGYIIKEKNDITILYKSKDSKYKTEVDKKSLSEEKSPKLNLFQKCELEIGNFTEDEKLKQVLLDYLKLRLSPGKDSRLLDRKLTNINQWKSLLYSLNTMSGDKIKIVEQSISKSWAVFVDIPKAAGVEGLNISNSRYSKEDIEKLKQLAEEQDKIGERRSF